ncbi:MAG: PKD domain-containing protein [Bacteroidota bacterium]
MKKAALTILSLIILLPVVVGQDYYQVKKRTRISTGMDEAVALPYKNEADSLLVYITQSTSVGASSPTDSEGRRLFTIFQYNEKTGQKKPFIDALVSQQHDGPLSFSGDYKTMVFSQQRPSEANRDFDPLGLYFAENVDGEWLNIREYEYNDDFAWLFSPALSHDGRTLYFAANFEDSRGGFDLYRSKLKGSSWSKPENLGAAVNTAGNELYPFIHVSGTLYFSSDGHDNIGGFDLYETTFKGGKWNQAVKLPPRLNGLSNDYHVYFSEDYKFGYLTSDRQSRSKEIFRFEYDIPPFGTPEPIKKTYYKYKIWDRNLDTVDHNLFRYSWVINDTLEIPGHEIIYKFPEPGTYVCELRVFDIQLDTFVVGQTVNTLNIRLNEQAVIVCPDTIPVNTPVEFDASSTYLPGYNVDRYLWEFGDGRFGEGIKTDHTFLYPGRYRVILGVEKRKERRRDDPEVRSNFRDVIVVAPN